MKIHLISALTPPEIDGIGDYTARIAAELARTCSVTLLTGAGQKPDPVANVTVVPEFRFATPEGSAELRRRVEADAPDWLLLQYNPFGFGKRGYCPHLIGAVRAASGGESRTRLAVMVHETFTSGGRWQDRLMRIWQRRQFRDVLRDADLVLCSCEAWARQATEGGSTAPVHVLPVGSNMPESLLSREAARERLGVRSSELAIGYFGTPHVSRKPELLAAAVEALRAAGVDTKVIWLGPAPAAPIAAPVVLAPHPADPMAISDRFAAMDIYLAPYSDGVSLRRTTFMTGLQHGVATVGTRGVNTDESLVAQQGGAFLLSDIDRPDDFAQMVCSLARDLELRLKVGARGRELYRAEYATAPVAARLLALLSNR